MPQIVLISSIILILITLNYVFGADEKAIHETTDTIPTPLTDDDCKFCKSGSKLIGNDPRLTKPIEQLVNFQCVKINTATFIPLVLKTPNAFVEAQFNFSIPFAILTHGFTDGFPGNNKILGKGWLLATSLTWVKNDVNVCIIDWKGLSTSINYFDAASISVQRVADYSIELILFLEAQGAKISEMSAAGHSLGAHICGRFAIALKKQNKPLKIIYGLDPAGPCFTLPCMENQLQRLDSNDAQIVQCIHTSGLLGQRPWCGCNDFYVSTTLLNPSKAHSYAIFIFQWTMTVNNKCYGTIDDKLTSELLGIHSQNKCGVYHVDGHRNVPYCDPPRKN